MPNSSRRSFAVVVAAVTAAGCAIAGAVPGAEARSATADKPLASSSSVPADVKAKMIRQQPYSAAAKQIQLATLRSGATGLAGIELTDSAVTVWWKGPVPVAVQRAIDAATVRVEVRAASYSKLELKAEADRLVAAMRADPASSLHAVGLARNGSRVVAEYDQGTKPAAGTALRTSRSATGKAVAVGAIPVEVTEGSRPVNNGRWDDGASGGTFSGGAAIINNETGGRCTSGFGVKNGSGQRFLLTAGHCGRIGGSWRNGNGSRQIGTASAEHVSHDLLLIPTSSDHFIWDGGATTDMFVKTVVNWDWAYGGEYVCQSGSTSGAICGIQNSGEGNWSFCDTDLYGTYECYSDLIRAAHVGGQKPSQKGDSGGPVFTLSGIYNVIAKGTVSGSSLTANNVMYYQDFGTAWRDFGIVPIG